MGASQNRVSFLGVPMIRIGVFAGPILGPPIYENNVSRPNFKGSKNFYESMEHT